MDFFQLREKSCFLSLFATQDGQQQCATRSWAARAPKRCQELKRRTSNASQGRHKTNLSGKDEQRQQDVWMGTKLTMGRPTGTVWAQRRQPRSEGKAHSVCQDPDRHQKQRPLTTPKPFIQLTAAALLPTAMTASTHTQARAPAIQVYK